jgi:DNA-binding PadR family transcriptional regulator
LDEERRQDDLSEAERRAQEAREHWRRAKEELREAFRSAREERRRAREAGETGRETVDETVEEITEAAREFARDVGEEARRFANEVWKGARQEWHGGPWREHWEKSFGKDWQRHWVFGGRRFRHWVEGEETNPFVAAILSRGGGLLALYVLHLLAEQPRHGNDVMRQIEQRTMGSWSSNPGAIYPLLSSMEANGLVQSQWEDPDKRTRRIYQLGDEGRQELARLRGALRPKVMEAIEVLHVLYDDLYGEDEGNPPAPPAGGSTTGGQASPGTGAGESTPGAPPPEADFDTRLSSAEDSGDAGTTPPPPGEWRRRLGRLFGGDAPATAFGS